MTTPTTIPPAALRRAEEIVAGYALGRIKVTDLYFAFFGFGHCCPRLPPDIETSFEVATAAHAVWSRAVVGDYSLASVQACRALFDRTIRDLVDAIDGYTTRKDAA